jgi:hypothetical protein
MKSKNVRPAAPPLHVVNIALNLVSGDNLAWQQRKAETFSVSSLHSGIIIWATADRPITAGTWRMDAPSR